LPTCFLHRLFRQTIPKKRIISIQQTQHPRISAQEILKKHFGFEQFRPQQAEIIERVLDKKDALVLMPAGGGKSVCFQIPALLMQGTSIVVSP